MARILVLDDEVQIVNSLQILMKLAGHDCRTATSAADARQIAAEFDPDVAVIDVSLSERTSGFDVADWFHQTHPNTSLILITGDLLLDLPTHLEALDPPPKLLHKPVHHDDLFAEIDEFAG